MKNKVLHALKKNKNTFCSGEKLSKVLDISRTAVWKHIRTLKKDGYQIISNKKKGYRLEEIPDFLLPEEIKYNLETKDFGKKIYHFYQTTSTIDEIKKLIPKQIKEGTLVIAEKQAGGRGRLQKKWESPFGGIWFSILLKPNVLPSAVPLLTLITGLIIAKTIKKITGIDAHVKWPNDIIVKYSIGKKKYKLKKICGILTEMNAEMDKVNYAILSIGINVNIEMGSFPEELQNIAGSLQEITGKKIVRVDFLKELLMNLEKAYIKFKKGKTKLLMDEYKKKSVVLGEKIKVVFPDKEVVFGKAVDIDSEGRLIVKSKKKEIKVIAGEISFV